MEGRRTDLDFPWLGLNLDPIPIHSHGDGSLPLSLGRDEPGVMI